MIQKLSFLLSFILFFSPIWGQNKDKKTWDVNNPTGNSKEVNFTVSEGTWMNLDVSPDGATIVFDLLGDIYSIPSVGGKATALRTGLAFEVQPRFSPDGKKILFTSDAGGGDNIWVMDANGDNAKQITKETFKLLNNPAWMPDGNYFVARKHFTSQRSLGAGEMWMYHISGGEGVQLTKRKNDQQDVNEPTISPDGRYVYFSEDMYPGGYFQYNKNPNSQIYIIRRYDRQEGKIKNIVSGPGGACRPQISKDGKRLAYVKRVRTKTVLCITDLESGQTFSIFDGLSKDQQEAWAIFGVYTGFNWTPDDKYIIIWGKGKLWKVDVKTGEATNIPFEVEAKHKLMETVRFENPVFQDKMTAKVIRQARTSPDGKTIIFNAIGYLWKKTLPDGLPTRLSKDKDFEFEPAFSPDGSEIVYVSWNDENKGAIYKMNLNSGRKVKLTNAKGIYRTPSFSPDGKFIVYKKAPGNFHQGYTYTTDPGIYMMPASGGEGKLLSPQGDHPQFSVDGKRVFFTTGGYLFGSLKKAFKSIKIDGSDEQVIFNTKYTNQFVPSPDNKWVAFTELHKAYVAPMPLPGKPIGLSAKTKAVPVAQVAKDAGINLHWSADSKKIHWTLGETYFSEPLTDRFQFLEGALDSLPPMDSVGVNINLVFEQDKPEGAIAFTNARIITMEGDQVIEEGTVLIENNLIKAVGKKGRVRIPDGAKVYDASGKTIMPGFVDVHAHVGNFRFGLSPQKQWQYYANLAYGITTVHDPSANTEMIFSQSEMIKAGHMVGPRLYSTGTILYGADGDFKAVINNLEDARSAIRRTKAFGAFSVKSYNQPRREQRQQVLQAARELGILVVPEGGSFFYHNLSMVADGHTGVEHNIPVAPLYEDVIQFWKATQTHNTPTLVVNYGSVSGEYYWYQHTNVWEKERLLTFTPRSVIDSRSRYRTMIPEEEYENGHILTAQSCAKLQNAGVNINLGSHGQLQGLAAHWEIWMFAQGGMSNMQVLRAATMNGASYIGMEKEIGSLKKGKLADLIVLDKNPLEDIRHTEFVRYTMVNGRLYDAATMNELGHYEQERSKFYFEIEGSRDAFPYYSQTKSHMQPMCSCRQ